MMGFVEWIEFNKKKVKKNVGSTSQSNQQNGIVGHEGKTTGNDSKIYTTTVHDFTQSKWEDYSGSN